MIGSNLGLLIGVALAAAHSLGPTLSALAGGAAAIGPDELKGAAEDFYFRCAVCHGPQGKGDGPMAQVLTVKPADLTRIAERNGGVFPDERVFRTISGLDIPPAHGTREMPVWGDLFLGEALENSVSMEDARNAAAQVTQRINRLIAYLKTIQVMH
jgi:mono/diheme cytochrome c family protein